MSSAAAAVTAAPKLASPRITDDTPPKNGKLCKRDSKREKKRGGAAKVQALTARMPSPVASLASSSTTAFCSQFGLAPVSPFADAGMQACAGMQVCAGHNPGPGPEQPLARKPVSTAASPFADAGMPACDGPKPKPNPRTEPAAKPRPGAEVCLAVDAATGGAGRPAANQAPTAATEAARCAPGAEPALPPDVPALLAALGAGDAQTSYACGCNTQARPFMLC